jgi:hypothetical protein
VSSGADLECRIEGAARGDHAQVFVEYKNGLADSVNNTLSECPRISDGGELFPEAASVHKALARYSVLRNKNFGRVGQCEECPAFNRTIYAEDESV